MGHRATATLRIAAYVTRRDSFAPTMATRDAWLADSGPLPASTLPLVNGVARPKLLV